MDQHGDNWLKAADLHKNVIERVPEVTTRSNLSPREISRHLNWLIWRYGKVGGRVLEKAETKSVAKFRVRLVEAPPDPGRPNGSDGGGDHGDGGGGDGSARAGNGHDHDPQPTNESGTNESGTTPPADPPIEPDTDADDEGDAGARTADEA